jgi:hypothetical protein
MSNKRHVLGADIDLDVVGAEQIATDTFAKVGRGRPSLTGRRGRSPQVTFRLSPRLRAATEKRAAREGKRVSDVAREALEQYLADAGKPCPDD